MNEKAIKLEAAYTVVGENGAAWVRAITPDANCPNINIDGRLQAMSIRAIAESLALRPTNSTVEDSKASVFPVLTCELKLPANTKRASIGNIALPMLKAEPKRIVVFGDSGCRMKKSDNDWQACFDSEQWPFEHVAKSAASFNPDLVIHVGDYLYRENPCPAGNKDCAGEIWGYGWDAWQADVFKPAATLLAKAPWVMVRGNHEECKRAGQGWFRFLDVGSYTTTRSCNEAANDDVGNFTAPYAVPLGKDTQLIVFDSSRAGGKALDPQNPKDALALNNYQNELMQVSEIAKKPGVASIFVNHHPILGFESHKDGSVTGGNAVLQAIMQRQNPVMYYPEGIQLAMHGHVHMFQAISFVGKQPATIVSGTGGDNLAEKFPDPFPKNAVTAMGVAIDKITHGNSFGFLLMEKSASSWTFKAYDHHAVLMSTCALIGSKLSCDKDGFVSAGK